MLVKTINVDVDRSTFPKKSVPPYLSVATATTIDVRKALLMLGTLTVPGGFSSASPARYWSWIRYFSAISTHHDLRITQDFSDIDPHQKTILSDDFGVAITTQLLFDRLGGFRAIVDGRQFVSLYASLVKASGSRRKFPKVGAGKCPDFVILDKSGKWHVLECKGTQTSAGVRNGQLKVARAQKNAIQVKGAVRGERLAAGLFLANEFSLEQSSVRIVDPDPEPYVIVDSRRHADAEKVERRLTISRALGLSGFIPFAEELSTPTQVYEDTLQFLNAEELQRTKIPVEERLNAAVAMLSMTEGKNFASKKGEFTGRQVYLDLPSSPFSDRYGFSHIEVSVGVEKNFLEKIREIPAKGLDVIEEVDEQVKARDVDSDVVMESSDREVSIRSGDFFIAKMTFS